MTNQILIFLSEIAFPLLGSAISIYVLPILNHFITEKQLQQAVKLAVEGVEQYMLTAEGEDKKKAVKEYILTKYNVSEAELNMLIESAVFDLNIFD